MFCNHTVLWEVGEYWFKWLARKNKSKALRLMQCNVESNIRIDCLRKRQQYDASVLQTVVRGCRIFFLILSISAIIPSTILVSFCLSGMHHVQPSIESSSSYSLIVTPFTSPVSFILSLYHQTPSIQQHSFTSLSVSVASLHSLLPLPLRKALGPSQRVGLF